METFFSSCLSFSISRTVIWSFSQTKWNKEEEKTWNNCLTRFFAISLFGFIKRLSSSVSRAASAHFSSEKWHLNGLQEKGEGIDFTHMLHRFNQHYRLHTSNQRSCKQSFHHLIPFVIGWLRLREDESFTATHWSFTSEVNYSVGRWKETRCWKKKVACYARTAELSNLLLLCSLLVPGCEFSVSFCGYLKIESLCLDFHWTFLISLNSTHQILTLPKPSSQPHKKPSYTTLSGA